MLSLTIKAENRKLRGSVIWFACFLLPIIPAIMGTFNYLQNLEILSSGWYSLWTQLTLFYSSFFYAPMIALYCSYLWRLEHLNHNWNVLMTLPVSVPDIFLGKLFIIIKVTIITQLWMYLLFCFCGKAANLEGLPALTLFLWAVRGTFAGFAIGALQLLLSMVIRSFALPIGISLAGSILGLFLATNGKGLYWPYSLMLMGMNSNSNEDKLAGDTGPFLISVLLFFFLFCSIGIYLLKHRDVKS